MEHVALRGAIGLFFFREIITGLSGQGPQYPITTEAAASHVEQPIYPAVGKKHAQFCDIIAGREFAFYF
jgi:hypothetical protein